MKILLVDPNPLDRKLAQTILEAGHHEVAASASVQEAGRLAAEFKPDAVVMDVVVSSREGRIVPFHIVTEGWENLDVPVVAMTALAMKGDRERILSAGYSGYIAKPIRYQEFLRLIEEIEES